MADIQQHRDGAQRAHDPADAQRIGDGLAQAVFLGDFEIDHRAGFVSGDLEHTDGVIRPVQRFSPVAGGLDGWVRPHQSRQAVGYQGSRVQAFLVDVKQADG